MILSAAVFPHGGKFCEPAAAKPDQASGLKLFQPFPQAV